MNRETTKMYLDRRLVAPNCRVGTATSSHLCAQTQQGRKVGYRNEARTRPVAEREISGSLWLLIRCGDLLYCFGTVDGSCCVILLAAVYYKRFHLVAFTE